jgi:hypothetical protein
VRRCEILSHCSHFLLVFNSSINILIYCWKDTKFRAHLLASLGLRSLQVPGGGTRGRQSSLLLVTMTAGSPLDRPLVGGTPDTVGDLEDSCHMGTVLDREMEDTFPR